MIFNKAETLDRQNQVRSEVSRSRNSIAIDWYYQTTTIRTLRCQRRFKGEFFSLTTQWNFRSKSKKTSSSSEIWSGQIQLASRQWEKTIFQSTVSRSQRAVYPSTPKKATQSGWNLDLVGIIRYTLSRRFRNNNELFFPLRWRFHFLSSRIELWRRIFLDLVGQPGL